MADHPPGNFNRLRLSALLLIAAAVVGLLVAGGVLMSLLVEMNLVDRYGFGEVPAEKIAIFGQFSEIATPLLWGVAIADVALLGWFIYEATGALDHLGVAHRRSKLFSGLSIIIPFASLYFPWAALGETRGTLKRIQETQTKLQSSVRAFDGPSFVLGLVWFLDVIATRASDAFGNGSMDDAASWHATMTSTVEGILLSGAFDLVRVIVVTAYALGLLKLYRAALITATADVFDWSPGVVQTR